jgi:hypothetical protein
MGFFKPIENARDGSTVYMDGFGNILMGPSSLFLFNNLGNFCWGCVGHNENENI